MNGLDRGREAGFGVDFQGDFSPDFPATGRDGVPAPGSRQASSAPRTGERSEPAPPQAAHPPAGNGGTNANALALAKWFGKKAGTVANDENIEYAGRILATVSIDRTKAVIGLALDPGRNPDWCHLVVSLCYCYGHWDHLLRAHNKSQAAARQERKLAAEFRELEEQEERPEVLRRQAAILLKQAAQAGRDKDKAKAGKLAARAEALMARACEAGETDAAENSFEDSFEDQ